MKRRRQNPESAMLQSEADDAIITSGAVMDEVYTEYAELDNDLSVLAKIEAKILAKDDGKVLSKEARARRRAIKERMRKLDRLIAAYTNRVIKQAKSRLKEIKASPVAKLHKRNIATVERDIFKLENMVKRKGADVRLMSNSLIGGLVTLEDSMGIKATMGARTLSKKDRERENIRKLMLASHDRWGQVKKHARNHDKFFLRGSEVFHKDYGSGIVIDNDGRKITVKFEGMPYKEMTKAKLTPGPVMWVDAQFHALNNKFEKGRAIAKSDIQRIVAKIVKIHNHTKPRGKLKTYKESKRALESLIGKIETRLSGDKMDKATVESLLLELEDFHNRVPARMKSEWAKADQRQWAGDVTKVRKALVKLKRKANPCVGFHFHGKDADELLKAVEESNTRTRGKVAAKKNPSGRAKKVGSFTITESDKKSVTLSRGLEIIYVNSIKGRRQDWAKGYQEAGIEYVFAYLTDMSNEGDGIVVPLPKSTSLSDAVKDAVKKAEKIAKKNPTAKRARRYGSGAEAKKSKSNKERGYRFKREQRAAAKGGRKVNPRKGMTISEFAHWLDKPEAEVDTQKQKLEYLGAAAEWEDYGVVTPDEMRDARAIVMAQNPGKKKVPMKKKWVWISTDSKNTAGKSRRWIFKPKQAKKSDTFWVVTDRGDYFSLKRLRQGGGAGFEDYYPGVPKASGVRIMKAAVSRIESSPRLLALGLPHDPGAASDKLRETNPKKDGGNDVSKGMAFNGWDIDSISIKYGVPELMLLSKNVGGEKYTLRVMYQLESGGRGKEPVIHSYGGWIYGGGLMDGRYVPSNERQAHWNYRNDLRLITRWANGIVKDKKVNPSKKNPQRIKKGLVVKGWLVSEYNPKAKSDPDTFIWSEPVIKLTKGNLALVLRRSTSPLRTKHSPEWSVTLNDLETGREIKSMGGRRVRPSMRPVRPHPIFDVGVDGVIISAINWAESIIDPMSNPRSKKKASKKKPAKKKATKKKATRKTKPEWQKLIDKCRKLWDDYCERPSKKRLKPVIEHLEKMKASTSKKVADERKSCLRIANKEARRLKLK